jgi:hypothetical protein
VSTINTLKIPRIGYPIDFMSWIFSLIKGISNKGIFFFMSANINKKVKKAKWN